MRKEENAKETGRTARKNESIIDLSKRKRRERRKEFPLRQSGKVSTKGCQKKKMSANGDPMSSKKKFSQRRYENSSKKTSWPAQTEKIRAKD